jgi:cytochrome c
MRAHILSVSLAALTMTAVAAASPSLAQAPAPGQPAAQAQPGAPAAGGNPDLAGLPAEYQNANLRNGMQQWTFCAACHLVADGTKNSVGPDLKGIFGRKAGANASFPNYTPALKSSGMEMTPEQIDKWITDPRAIIPTTAMIFPGIKKPEDRRDVIAYLWTKAGGTADGVTK